MPELKADFVGDLMALAERELKARGIDQPRLKNGHRTPDPLCRLLTVEHRHLPPRRRRSVWSDVLTTRAADAALDAVKRIASESEAGQDLSHYLGRGVRRSEPDAQLNDWGISHLHLGKRRPGKPLSESSSELLFVMATLDNFYLIDIGDHGSFADEELFETVHRNWPQLIADSRARNVVPGSSSLSPERRTNLRRSGLVMLTQTRDGTIYLPHGLGQMTNGLNPRVRRMADWMLIRVRHFQDACEEGSDKIFLEVAKLGAFRGESVDLQLTEYDAVLVAQDIDGRFWLSIDETGHLQFSYRRSRLAPSQLPPPRG